MSVHHLYSGKSDAPTYFTQAHVNFFKYPKSRFKHVANAYHQCNKSAESHRNKQFEDQILLSLLTQGSVKLSVVLNPCELSVAVSHFGLGFC